MILQLLYICVEVAVELRMWPWSKGGVSLETTFSQMTRSLARPTLSYKPARLQRLCDVPDENPAASTHRNSKIRSGYVFRK